MDQLQPTFPPLLAGHQLDAGASPVDRALEGAAEGVLGAGDLVWSEQPDNLSFALVLEPDVSRERCGEMLFVAMVAFGDAAGALIPPEVSITYRWPNLILMNDAQIGHVDLIVSAEEQSGIPDWMVLAVHIHIMPDIADADPGRQIDVTTMWDEGCGEITQTQLLESVARHTVALIHAWSEDGFGPIHEQWSGRLYQKRKLADDLVSDCAGELIGLDETGNALLSGEAGTSVIPTIDALERLRQRRAGK